MRALRVRLVGLGTSLVLVVTSLVGAGTALADHDNNVAVACSKSNADIATSGGAATSGGTNRPSSNNVAIAISAATHWWPTNIIVAVATSGGANGPSSNIVQANSTVARGEGAVSSGVDVRCVAVAARD
jgi:hypothetical protein